MKNRYSIWAVIIALMCLLVILATGCSEYNDDRGRGDAPVQNREGDDKPAVVINFPDNFANVAIKCYKGTAVISTTREAPVQIVPDSVMCNGDNVVRLMKDG